MHIIRAAHLLQFCAQKFIQNLLIVFKIPENFRLLLTFFVHVIVGVDFPNNRMCMNSEI